MRAKFALASLILLTSLSFSSCYINSSEFSFHKYGNKINMKQYNRDGHAKNTCILMATTSLKEVKKAGNI